MPRKADSPNSLLLVFLLMLLVFPANHLGQATNGFRWLDPQKDNQLVARVKEAFAEELKPDDPARVHPYVAYRHKYIHKVGVVDSAALVIIGQREAVNSPPDDYFEAHSYDLKTGKKFAIKTRSTLWLWQPLKLAHFERSAVPDIVFTYDDCTECEAYHLLASFQFDPNLQRWKMRSWGNDADSILIDGGLQNGDEEGLQYDCLFTVKDLTKDGLDDVAVRCQVTGSESRKVIEQWTHVYSIVEGVPKEIVVKEPRELSRIHGVLCEEGRSRALCE